MHKQKLFMAMLIGLSASTVQAHDAWVAFDNGAYRVIYGHPGNTQSYDAAKLKQVSMFDGQGAPLPAKQSVQNESVLIDPTAQPGMISQPSITTLVFDNGFWTKTADTEKSINESKRNHPDYLEAFHSMKYGKSLFGWSEAAARPQGLEFEIVPLANPFALKDGEPFPVQVLYQGKPLAGALVGYGGDKEETKVKTDAEGKAEVMLKRADLLVARHRAPLPDNPDADALALGANLFLSPL